MRSIDLFAGAGGFTTGARAAGFNVVWAANHWRQAVDIHARNHLDTLHSCQDLMQADFTLVPAHDHMHASPSCVGHCDARGTDKPQHDKERSTAWAVVTCAEVHLPSFITIENVPEFTRWRLYPAWRLAMETLGYHLTECVVDAADFGIPQNRERLIILMRRGKRIAPLHNPRLPHKPASSFIDFDSGRWSHVRKPGRARNTIARIEAGRRDLKTDRFLAPYYGSGSGKTGRSIDRPIGTITTKDRYALIDGDRMRMLTVDEYRRGMGFPENYLLPPTRHEAIKMLGNAVPPPLATAICNHIKQEA